MTRACLPACDAHIFASHQALHPGYGRTALAARRLEEQQVME